MAARRKQTAHLHCRLRAFSYQQWYLSHWPLPHGSSHRRNLVAEALGSGVPDGHWSSGRHRDRNRSWCCRQTTRVSLYIQAIQQHRYYGNIHSNRCLQFRCKMALIHTVKRSYRHRYNQADDKHLGSYHFHADRPVHRCNGTPNT